jgi:hypothetical protein
VSENKAFTADNGATPVPGVAGRASTGKGAVAPLINRLGSNVIGGGLSTAGGDPSGPDVESASAANGRAASTEPATAATINIDDQRRRRA